MSLTGSERQASNFERRVRRVNPAPTPPALAGVRGTQPPQANVRQPQNAISDAVPASQSAPEPTLPQMKSLPQMISFIRCALALDAELKLNIQQVIAAANDEVGVKAEGKLQDQARRLCEILS